MSATTDQDMIDRFIRERGVTQCPPACAAPTTASISRETAEAHAARGIDPVGDMFRKRAPHVNGWAIYWERKRAAAVGAAR